MMKMRDFGEEEVQKVEPGRRAGLGQKVEPGLRVGRGQKVEPDLRVGRGQKVELEVSQQQFECAKRVEVNQIREILVVEEVIPVQKIVVLKIATPKAEAGLRRERQQLRETTLGQGLLVQLDQVEQIKRLDLCIIKVEVAHDFMAVAAAKSQIILYSDGGSNDDYSYCRFVLNQPVPSLYRNLLLYWGGVFLIQLTLGTHRILRSPRGLSSLLDNIVFYSTLLHEILRSPACSWI